MIKMFTDLDPQKLEVEDIPSPEKILKLPFLKGCGSIFPLVKVSLHLMPVWQQRIKRMMDIIISSLAILILSPIYLLTAISVKLTSKGPILFIQERIGLNGKPFQMIKYRTMFINAEKQGPQLSSKDDPRITRFGKLLRKVRLDEIPQLFTVLTGTMSMVGPRPEREFYINQIVEKAPHYLVLLKVKPGLTSWGQIKYGYAENISQMVERLSFDIDYVENLSIMTDLKVLVHTIFVILQASGR
jgi:lipopolysaccharide/colanic/teichoic acid biosynthesis glycosyltransferase